MRLSPGFPLFFLGVLASVPGLAQVSYTTARIPYPLENNGHSARAMALGSAYSALEADASCLYWNPAGLDGLPSPELSLAHESWLTDISQQTFLGAFPLGHAGALALGANYLGFGDLQGFDGSGNPSQALHPFRASLALGWGGTFTRGLSLGFSGKTFYQYLDGQADSLCGSLTCGLLWRALPTLRIGAYYTFLASLDSPDLGLLKIGEAWAIPFLKDEPTLLLVDFSMPPKGVYVLQGGLEQRFLSHFFARLGYQQELRDNQVQGFRGLTAGAGVEWRDFVLDYSCLPDGDLGLSQMVGLTYRFPQAKPSPLPQGPQDQAPVGFIPADQISPSDQVVKVEVHFDLPSEGPSSQPPSPDLQRSIDLASQRIQADPKDAQAWVDLGNLYWRAGKPEYTVQSFEEALKLAPGNGPLRAWLERYKGSPKTP